MGNPGDPCCGLRAELRPQGGVGLGWMEVVGAAKGAVLAAEPKGCREHWDGGCGSRSRGCCDTQQPQKPLCKEG